MYDAEDDRSQIYIIKMEDNDPISTYRPARDDAKYSKYQYKSISNNPFIYA